MFLITTNYYKSYNITRKDKDNLRFLPSKLTNILLYYLVYIIPLYTYFNIEYLKDTRFSPYLFKEKGKPISSTILSNTLFKESSRVFRDGLSLNPYRHLINYLIKEKLGYNTTLQEDEDEEQDIVDTLANRSTKVGNINYSRDISLSTATTKSMYQLSLKLCQDYFTYFNINTLSLKVNLKEDIYTSYRSTSLDFSIEKYKTSKDYSIISKIVDTSSNLTKSLEDYLKEFFKSRLAVFKDEYQGLALKAILNNPNYLTYINRTASGKSLIYFLPVYIDKNRVNLVLTPRVTLKQDLYKRAKEKDLQVSILEDIDLATSTPKGLILGSIDSLLRKEFSLYIYKTIKAGYNLTIFLDEVHVLLLEQDFRPVLNFISTLLKFRVALVFITATLPKSLLKLLEKEFCLTKGQNQVLRASTVRKDISYNIHYYNPKDDLQLTLARLENRLRTLSSLEVQKGLLFVSSIEEGLKISREGGLLFYHAKLPKGRQDIVLQSFLEDISNSILVITSALSIGVDFSQITFTIHFLPVYSLLNFVQESSRIRGRGHSFLLLPRLSPKESIRDTTLIKDLPVEENIQTIQDFKAIDKAFIVSYIKESYCLRRVINKFLDNIDTKGCTSIEAPCSICKTYKEQLESTALIEEARVKETTLSLINLEECLLSLNKDYCLFCLFIGPYKECLKHTYSTCNVKKEIEFDNEIILNKKQVTNKSLIPSTYACFKCLFPFKICNKLKEDYKLTDCLDSTVIWLVLSIIFYRGEKFPSSMLYNNPVIDLEYNTDRARFFKRLLGKSYITNSIKATRIVDIVSKINPLKVLEIREEEEALKNLDRSTLKRPTTPTSSAASIYSNLVVSPNPRERKRRG